MCDFFTGITILAFAIYIYTKVQSDFMNVNIAWFGWSAAVLGLLLILVAALSFTAVVSIGLRSLMWFSSRLSLLITFTALCLGSVMFARQKEVENYLDNNGTTIGLTSEDINVVTEWYTVVACAMFGVAVLELIRFKLSGVFLESVYRVDDEYAALLNEEDKEWQEKLSSNAESREEKYRDLRTYYKVKYAKNIVRDGSTDNRNRI